LKNVFVPTDILVPQNIDMQKWSVVACDQYTSQPEYWENVKKTAGDSPSALNIIFPEIYLENGDKNERINSINATMKKYTDDGIFKEYPNAFIYVEREADGKIRQGLVGAVDLECYDYSKDSTSAVRATEGTVIERIPPRVEIRKNAPLELPHVMILADDIERTVIEPLGKKKDKFTKLYDFELMCGGGRIAGYLLDKESNAEVLSAIDKLPVNKGLLFAVGDGNHSLATAKECWESLKKELTDEEMNNHPARYALAELVNIHSSALEFEPIHRVIFDVDAEKLIAEFTKENGVNTETGEKNIKAVSDKFDITVGLNGFGDTLEVAVLQSFLDKYLKENDGKIDYIHGDDVTVELGSKENNIGFLLPAMDKSDLFKSVAASGALPRKTFSMGHAHEKRFYLECRKIR